MFCFVIGNLQSIKTFSFTRFEICSSGIWCQTGKEVISFAKLFHVMHLGGVYSFPWLSAHLEKAWLIYSCRGHWWSILHKRSPSTPGAVVLQVHLLQRGALQVSYSVSRRFWPFQDSFTLYLSVSYVHILGNFLNGRSLNGSVDSGKGLVRTFI